MNEISPQQLMDTLETDGYSAALCGLQECYQPRISKFITKYLRSKECDDPLDHSEEIVQSLWLNVSKHLNNFLNGSNTQQFTNVFNFLFTVQINLCRKHIKICRKYSHVSIDDCDADFEESYLSSPALHLIIHTENNLLLSQYLRSLSPKEVIILRFRSHDLTFADIGDILEISEDDSKKTYYRAIRKIRKKFSIEESKEVKND